MSFYTNVVRYGNNLLIREVVNGQRVNSKLKYKPTLFVPVVKPTNWKTLDDKNVTPMEFGSIKECSEWLKSYEDQPHQYTEIHNTHIPISQHNILIV